MPGCQAQPATPCCGWLLCWDDGIPRARAPEWLSSWSQNPMEPAAGLVRMPICCAAPDDPGCTTASGQGRRFWDGAMVRVVPSRRVPGLGQICPRFSLFPIPYRTRSGDCHWRQQAGSRRRAAWNAGARRGIHGDNARYRQGLQRLLQNSPHVCEMQAWFRIRPVCRRRGWWGPALAKARGTRHAARGPMRAAGPSRWACCILAAET